MKSQSVKGAFFAKFTMQRLTFNQFRKEHKLSLLATFFLLFKSFVGLGLFNYPYAIGKSGYLYGTFLGLLITYMTAYGMYSLARIASTIEKAKFGLKKMHNYHGK